MIEVMEVYWATVRPFSMERGMRKGSALLAITCGGEVRREVWMEGGRVEEGKGRRVEGGEGGMVKVGEGGMVERGGRVRVGREGREGITSLVRPSLGLLKASL